MSKVEMDALGKSIDDHLGALGVFEMKLMPLLALGLWLGLWLGLNFRWWTALLIGCGVFVAVLLLTVQLTYKYIGYRARAFQRRWKFGTPEYSTAFQELAESNGFELKKDFLFMASGLKKEQCEAGLLILGKMAEDIGGGKSPKEALLNAATMIREADEFQGEEFMENCHELLADPNPDAAKTISKAALMLQTKVLLGNSEPGEPSNTFSTAVMMLVPYYNYMGLYELKRNSRGGKK